VGWPLLIVTGVPCVWGITLLSPRPIWTHMPQLEWNFRYVLVTYAQCGDLDPWRVVERFSSLGAECIVGREHHEDGGLHLHVFADFGRKFRSRKADVLDVDGRHPNLAPIKRTPAKAYDYAIKDGDVVAGGLERPVEGGVGSGASADKWARITQAQDRDEFWALVHELDPKAAACSFNALSKYADWRFAEVPPVYEHDGRIEFVQGDADGRDDWLSQSGIGLDEPFLGKSCTSPQGAPPAPVVAAYARQGFARWGPRPSGSSALISHVY
jgi:hypothetical protein